MFFFFFKQKTAYEMRISDWSSDVCSSDLDRQIFGLHAHSAEHVGPTGCVSTPHETAPVVVIHDHRVFGEFVGGIVAPDVTARTADRGILARKIGRASCRERVCQYV